MLSTSQITMLVMIVEHDGSCEGISCQTCPIRCGKARAISRTIRDDRSVKEMAQSILDRIQVKQEIERLLE